MNVIFSEVLVRGGAECEMALYWDSWDRHHLLRGSPRPRARQARASVPSEDALAPPGPPAGTCSPSLPLSRSASSISVPVPLSPHAKGKGTSIRRHGKPDCAMFLCVEMLRFPGSPFYFACWLLSKILLFNPFIRFSDYQCNNGLPSYVLFGLVSFKGDAKIANSKVGYRPQEPRLGNKSERLERLSGGCKKCAFVCLLSCPASVGKIKECRFGSVMCGRTRIRTRACAICSCVFIFSFLPCLTRVLLADTLVNDCVQIMAIRCGRISDCE